MDKTQFVKALHTQNFWLAVVSAVVMVANSGLGLHIPSSDVLGAAGVIISLIFGGSAIAHKALSLPDGTGQTPTQVPAQAPAVQAPASDVQAAVQPLAQTPAQTPAPIAQVISLNGKQYAAVPDPVPAPANGQ